MLLRKFWVLIEMVLSTRSYIRLGSLYSSHASAPGQTAARQRNNHINGDLKQKNILKNKKNLEYIRTFKHSLCYQSDEHYADDKTHILHVE